MEQATIVRTESVPVGKIQVHPENARRGDMARIAASLRENGQYRPIVVHEDTGNILAGNHTYRAAVDKLGWTHIEATFVRCTEEKARALLVVDNRAADDADYDVTALAELLEQVESDDLLGAAGYSQDEFASLLAALEEEEPPEELGADGEVEPMNSLEDKAEAYENSTSRMMVLNFEAPQFAYVVDHLADLGAGWGLDSNTDVIMKLVADATGTTPPEG